MPGSNSPNASPLVSVVVLSYNSWTHLRHLLPSLLVLDYPSQRLELLLVDNASTDGSVKWVEATYPSVRIVRNSANLGYAAGNNAGVRAAKGEWVAILNPDMRVESNWLTELIQPTLGDPLAVCVASLVLSWDGATIDFADAAVNFMGWGCQPGFGAPRPRGSLRNKPLLFANGGAMLIKRQLFLDVGGFDPDFFAYFEDVDLGWRLRLMGHKVELAARAVVYHRHHGSWGEVADAKKWVMAERNTLFTLIKNYDEDTLARILPLALLLSAQRAYLDIRPDPAAFGYLPEPPTADAESLEQRHYIEHARRLLRRGAYLELARRAANELKHRGSRALKPQRERPFLKSVDGGFQVPALSLSRLVAGRDVKRALPTLMEKRAWIQAHRQLDDQQLFPLFKWSLISNFGDDQFVQAMNLGIDRFGLAELFSSAVAPAPFSAQLRRLSHEVSALILDLVDKAFTLSGAMESEFRLGKSDPEPIILVPFASVAILAGMNHILWSLPGAPLPELLAWLKEQLEAIT
jgi:GT2 family glycosyltransferase